MVVVHRPGQLSFASDAARRKHELRYRNYRSAINVWRQLQPTDRKAILLDLGYSEEDASRAAMRDDLQGVKATGAKRERLLSTIRLYPRSPRARAAYAEYLSTHPPPKEVLVRKHERELRAKGLRRPPEVRLLRQMKKQRERESFVVA